MGLKSRLEGIQKEACKKTTGGAGTSVQTSPTGQVINALVGRATPLGDFPWKVTKRAKRDEEGRVLPGQFQALVSINSDILLSPKLDDNLEVTGLGSWFDLISSDVIWIYVVVSDQSATSATIQSYGQGNSGYNPTAGAWDDSGGFVQNDGGTPPSQIALNQMIAYTTPDLKGNPYLIQSAFNHFEVYSRCVEGLPAQMMKPASSRRYGITAPGV